MLSRADLKKAMQSELQRHVGQDNCISMAQLHLVAGGDQIDRDRRYDQTRVTRSIVAELRREGCPIGFYQGRAGGYFWAADPRELESTIQTFHGRALSSLAQEKALRRVTARELAQQVELELESPTATEQPEEAFP